MRIRAVIHAANMLNVENRKIAGNMRQLRNKAVAKAHERLARDALKHRDDEQGRRMEALKVGSPGALPGCMPGRLPSQLLLQEDRLRYKTISRAGPWRPARWAVHAVTLPIGIPTDGRLTLFCCLRTGCWPPAASISVHCSLQRSAASPPPPFLPPRKATGALALVA